MINKSTHNSRARRQKRQRRKGKALKLLHAHRAWLRRKIREEDKGW